jgi:formylmethanofuran dehydrogenase subunit C
MAEQVLLSLRNPIDESIEVEGVTADRFAALSAKEIGALPAWIGSRQAALGDFFDVKGERAARVRVDGDLRRVHGIAAGMSSGEMLIFGDVGSRLGAGMSGGWVDVRGGAGNDAGQAMRGGALRVTGDAGDRVGAASPGASKGMTGGEIVIGGSAGAGVGARVRRGLIAVEGNVGDDAARAMIAGTLVVVGRIGANPGLGSKRGSIVALGGIEVPETYRYACTYQPTYVRLLLTYLRRQYGVFYDDAALDGHYRRHCGDAGEPGKGEILERVQHS